MHARLFDDQALDQLEAAVYELLTETGMKVCHEALLRRLQQHGAQVDYGRQRAQLPEQMIDEVLALQRAAQVGAASAEAERPPPGTPLVSGLGYDIAPRIYDFELRRERLATRADLEALIDLGDALPYVQSIGCPVVMSEVDPRVEAIEAFALLVCRTNKPPSVVSVLPQHNEYFAEIGEIVLGPSVEPRFIGTGGFLITPLTVGDRVAEMMLEGQRYRAQSCGVGSMAVGGLSSPVSIAGTIAVIAAELLGGCVVAHCANPHAVSLVPCTASGILDMRSSKACFGTPEAALQDAGTAELFERRLGGQCGIAGPGYIDGRVPGLQVVYEKLLKAHVFHTLRGHPLRLGNPGLIDAGSVYSPTQLMVELELNEGLHHADLQVPVTEELIGLRTIHEVVATARATFLTTDHTLAHFRELWHPELADRAARPFGGLRVARGATPSGAEGRPAGDAADEEQVLTKADAKWRRIVAEHVPPDIEPARVREVERVVAAARRHLLGGSTESAQVGGSLSS